MKELGVLLEIGDLLPRRLGDVSTSTDERRRLRRDLVHVHLVTHQQEPIRPPGRLRLQMPRIDPQRIDTKAEPVVGWRERVGRLLGRTDPTGSEHQPGLAFTLARPNRTTRPAVVRRPNGSTLQAHLVGRNRPWLETLDQHDRIVMPKHLKRVRPVPKHFHHGGRVGLDPDGGGRRPHIAKQRAKGQLGVIA